MTVDVVNPDSTNPLALSEDREQPRQRDTTAVQRLADDAEGFGASPIDFTQPQEPLPVTIDTSQTEVQSNPVVPRVYPNVPANIVPPTGINIPSIHQNTIDELFQRNSDFQLQDEIQLNHGLSNVLNAGTPFGPNRPMYVPPDISIGDDEYPQLISDSVEYRLEQSANELSPTGINPRTGEIVPGTRNALSGQPFSSRLRQFVFGDTGNEFEESLPEGQPIRNFGRRFVDAFQGLRAAGQTNQGRRIGRFLTRVNPGANLFPTPDQFEGPIVDRFTSNLGPLSERIVTPFAQPGFEPTTQFQQSDPSFLEALGQESLQARDVFTGLAANDGGEFAPAQGRFGDFGSTGILSGLLYLANVPEGLASGLLYEVTNLGVDLLTDYELPPDRVRLFDALRGRDLGFMNTADDARYLSFVDNPLLENIPILNNRTFQNTAGFVADVAWGGVADFGLNQLARPITNGIDTAVSRALRVQTLEPDTIQSAVRNLIDDTPANTVPSINRMIDDAIEARRLNPLPLRSTPEIDNIISDSRRSLLLDADGIPINIRVAPIGRALAGETPSPNFISRSLRQIQPQFVEGLEQLQLQRLNEINTSLIESQSRITENLVRIEEARRNFDTLTEVESPLNEFADVQLSIIRSNQQNNTALNNSIRDLAVERRRIEESLGLSDELAAQQIRESVARNSIRLQGDVIETVAIDETLNATLPLIPKISVEESIPIPNVLQNYRLDPLSINPERLTLTRRTDEQLTELAKFHRLLPPSRSTLNPQQLQALRQTHSQLLARYGNPIDNNLSSPLKRIEIQRPDLTTDTPQLSIVPDTPPTSTPVLETTQLNLPPISSDPELPPISRRAVNSLSKRRDELFRRLMNVTDIAEEQRLLQRLDRIDNKLSELISQSDPASVAQIYIESLPRRSTPQTPESQQIAGLLASAESRFTASTSEARNLQRQLIEAQQILSEQRNALTELPPIERTSLQHEVATRNNYVPNNDGIPNVASPVPPSTLEVQGTPQRIITEPPDSSAPIESLTFYHGTKSRISNLSNTDYTLGSSVSNELGPALYLTTDPQLAGLYAKAQPAVDRVPNPSLRSDQIGHVHQMSLDIRQGTGSFIEANVIPEDGRIGSMFEQLVRERLGRQLPRSISERLNRTVHNLVRKRPYVEWFDKLRARWNTLNPGSESSLVEFNSTFIKQLSGEFQIDGAIHRQSNGHLTVAMYNNDTNIRVPVIENTRFNIGTGAPEEQALNRYAADLHTYNQFRNRTAKANMEASRLAIDTRAVQNLKEATKDAYRRSIDDTTEMLQVNNRLDDAVRIENSRRLGDINEEGPRQATRSLRRFRGDNNAPCI